MLVMDRFKATKYIREVLKLDIPIYALTGESKKYFQQQIVEAGFHGSYTKPF
jgi:CheY-like chemotaxis protein